MTGLPLFTQWVADETNAANQVKRHLPVLVVMGNPPYSGHSANKSDWIDGLLKGKLPDGGKTGNYYAVNGQPLGERNPKWLQDDYVKFIRFGQWRIEQSGGGILAFISNNGYLDNPTFRGMRQSLRQTFTEIYLLDLHGSAKKRETAPDGSVDENVFDIQQGVGIGIFVKQPGQAAPATVYHADLWGSRTQKYTWLLDNEIDSTTWAELSPGRPFYLFIPQDIDLLGEYNKGWKITDVVPVNVLGFQTHRDKFAIDFDYDVLRHRIEEMRDTTLTDEEFRQKYNLRDNRDWQLSRARVDLRQTSNWKDVLLKCSYRPFDWRYCYFSEIAADYPRRELKDHVVGKDNLCLLLEFRAIPVVEL
jgi:predicted helicase